jgi:transcriptional regulator with XRE-family HTH domain
LSGGSEIRFLRKQLELTQRELADRMRVSDQTIANYEKDATPVPGATDMSLRIMYALTVIPDGARAAVAKYIVDELSKHDQPARLPEVTRKRIVHGWEERELSAACC